MYAPTYGYGPGNNSSPFNPNGAPQQPHTPHQQQPGQQPQHMMYNPQQYGVGGHQSPYGTPGPGMGGNVGGMGMMQNTGMAHMSGGNVPSYQTPYTSSPYGGNIPTTTTTSLPPNFVPSTSNASSFPMNAPNMIPQHQRMQPPPTSTPTHPNQRASPYGGVPHSTPPNPGLVQSQFNTPQNTNQSNLQTPNNQQAGVTILTPQTPNFPPASGNVGTITPLSPGSEVREKERVTLLLEINRELLMEVMRLQAAQAEAKKEEPVEGSPEKEKTEKEKADKLKSATGREYVECMRRLQSNLAYLAAIADRSHKPSSQIPPHPAIMSAPPLTPKSAVTSPTEKKEDSEEKKHEEIEDRIETLKEQYKRLQALFPGVDPRKEPPIQSANAAGRAQAQAMQAKQNQSQSQGIDQNQAQKLQNDLLRQKMMQQQAAQMQQQQGMQVNQQMQNR